MGSLENTIVLKKCSTIFFNAWVGKVQSEDQIHPSASFHKQSFIRIQPCSYIYMLSRVAFMLRKQK